MSHNSLDISHAPYSQTHQLLHMDTFKGVSSILNETMFLITLCFKGILQLFVHPFPPPCISTG